MSLGYWPGAPSAPAAGLAPGPLSAAELTPGALPAAVLLDMDGTLVDTEKVWDISLAQLAGWLGGSLSRSLRASLVGSSLPATVAALHAEFDVGSRVQPAASAAYLLERTGELFRGGVQWRPGARRLLTELAAAGIPMALVTSTYRGLADLVLADIGSGWFAASVCGDEVRHVKPHPAPYLRAAELLRVDPARCVAIEDSDTGTRSALAAGCAVLTVPADAPVPDGPGRHFAASLTDVGLAELAALINSGSQLPGLPDPETPVHSCASSGSLGSTSTG